MPSTLQPKKFARAALAVRSARNVASVASTLATACSCARIGNGWWRRPRALKTRSHSTVLADLLNGMGADAQFMAFSEVYTGLERGILDAAVSCGPCGAGLRWFEVTDYLVGPIVALGVTYISMNEDRWNEIPADLQAIIIEEADAHSARNRVLVTKEWTKSGVDDNVAGGMEYIEFTPEIKTALRKASIEQVIPNWVDRVGGVDTDAVRMYNTFVAPLLGVSIGADGQAVEN